MKKFFYLIPMLFLLITACQKDKKNDERTVCPNPGSIWEGPWVLNAYWYSPGAGDIVWTPAAENVDISFSAGNIFSSTKTTQDRYLISRMAADTVVKIYKQGTADTSVFYLKVKSDTLYLYNAGCIEGCIEKYARPVINVIQ